MDISLRDRGWAGVAQPDASLLHVATLDESALMRFEIESTRGQEASTFLERLARGAGGEQMSFDAIAPWQADTPARTRRAPGNRTPVVGHRVRGLLEPSSGENSTVYGLVLYGVPQPSGLLIVWGTAEGSREKVQELFSQMEDIMKSLRRRPNSP
jgi:hypothetical protein